jgi:hypothetical protein
MWNESRRLAWRGAIVGLIVCGLSSGLGAQNPGPSAWLTLPDSEPLVGGQPGNNAATDLHLLDVLVEGFNRYFYTTEGHTDLTIPTSVVLFPGRLRAIDVAAPFPDLSLIGGEWQPDSTLVVRNPVAGWNDALIGTGTAQAPNHGKGASLVGMTSHNGFLFVSGPHRNEPDFVTDPFGNMSPERTSWNGVSVVYGPAPPGEAFDPLSDELFSAGSGPTQLGDPLGDTGMRQAVPEGSAVATTNPPFAEPSSFLFVGNYCGRDAAGHLLVQVVTNPAKIRRVNRHHVPLYELLANYTGGALKPPPGPLGDEVPRYYFTCPWDSNELPDCSGTPSNADPGLTNTLEGNKLRPVLVFKVPANSPNNAGRLFLVAGLNLDPFHINDYDAEGDIPLGTVPLDLVGRDDGKYDYLAITDITDMIVTWPNPMPTGVDLWRYDDVSQWSVRTKFLRLPPDVPAGWDWTQGRPPIDSGHDFSEVTVPDPTGVMPDELVEIVGGGTLKTIAAHPTAPYVYVVASDQGQEVVIENATQFDGGFHVPHLYVIDFGACDFTDQADLNNYSSSVLKYRFNKSIVGQFDTGVNGSVLVNSTIPGMPLGPPITADISATKTSGAVDADIGTYYPGEYQLDPTARTRMVSANNGFLNADQDRLYIGTVGKPQLSSTDALIDPLTGAVFVLSLAQDGSVSYLHTIVVPESTVNQKRYQVSGLQVISDAARLGSGAMLMRNVVAITALHTRALGFPFPDHRQDRLLFVEDP